MSDLRTRLAEELLDKLPGLGWTYCEWIVDELLSLPGIAIVERDEQQHCSRCDGAHGFDNASRAGR
jgi:hypothetical protein